jgi:outer membrane protein OmpA-like peptidoglycan-associated protein
MKKYLAILMVAAMMLGLLASCGTHNAENTEDQVTTYQDQPYNLALIAAIANNNPVLDTEIRELSQLPNLAGSTYTVIQADATPGEVISETVPSFAEKGYTAAMIERCQTSVGAAITAQISAAVPDSPEVDLAAATSLAIRSLRANAVDGRENLLVYYASMISTAGVINMIDVPVCEMDVDSSVAALVETLDWDLTGIQVIVYCCGDVSGDQQSLSDRERSTLKTFYETLFLAKGAASVTFMDDLQLEETYCFDQQVSVMRTEGVTSGLQATLISYEDLVTQTEPQAETTEASEAAEPATVEEQLETVFAEGDILSFDEASISFLPDSTELADPEAATAALAYVIDYMQAHPAFTLLICGTTTSAGEKDSCLAFSEARANSVRDLLVNSGVDPEQIQTVGCGWSSSLYVPDRAADGSLDATIAPQNRTVKLVDQNSDTAAQILSSLAAG